MTTVATLEELTSTQRERYNSIYPILGKFAINVITNLKGRGRSSWRNVLSNITLVNNAKTEKERAYLNHLDQEIDLEEIYTPEHFTNIVSEARFNTGMPPFESRIETNCEQELFKLFIWVDVFTEDEKPVFLGYKPVCRLKR